MDWSFMAGPASSLIGGLFGASNSAKAAQQQFENQMFLMEKQHEYNVSDFKHRYQWSVGDMRNAGLNPILAATSGIGGSINGVSAGNAAMAQTPDFGTMLGNAMSSAFQTQSQKEIAKMQNEVAKEELRLKDLEISSAKEKRENDIRLDNLRFDLEKWKAEESNRRAEMMNNAQIENMVDTLKATIQHYERMDANDSVKAAAAMRQADASGLMASIQHELGLSNIELNKAREAFLGLQSANEAEQLQWQQYLNEHKEVRGAVGLLGSFFDTAGLVLKAGAYANMASGILD